MMTAKVVRSGLRLIRAMAVKRDPAKAAWPLGHPPRNHVPVLVHALAAMTRIMTISKDMAVTCIGAYLTVSTAANESLSNFG